MAIMLQKPMFDWKEIDKTHELYQLELILKHLPDNELISLLEKKRKKGGINIL